MKIKVETEIFPSSLQPTDQENITIWYGKDLVMVGGMFWYVSTEDKYIVRTRFGDIAWEDIVYWAYSENVGEAFRAQFKHHETLADLRKCIEYFCKCVVEPIEEDGAYIKIKAFVDSENKADASKTYDAIATYINRNCTSFNKEFSIRVCYRTLYCLGEK